MTKILIINKLKKNYKIKNKFYNLQMKNFQIKLKFIIGS